MGKSQPRIIVADASVLVNFLKVDRVDLLSQFPATFMVSDHVAEEITIHDNEQCQRFQNALANEILVQESLTSFEEVKLFGELTTKGRLGYGECAAIAIAIRREYQLAIDDRRARNEALRKLGTLNIFRTQDLIVEMIQANLLDVAEADSIKTTWSNQHRFHLKFSSFADLL